jgi:hypothetical protein
VALAALESVRGRPIAADPQYRRPSIPEPVHGVVLIHFGKIEFTGSAAILSFKKGADVKNATLIGHAVRGIAVSLPAPGAYEIEVTSDGKNIGQLCVGQQKSFAVLDGDNFFELASVCAHSATPDNKGKKGNVTVIAVVSSVTVVVIILAIAIVCVVRRRRDGNRDKMTPLGMDSGTAPYTV